jgi:hypothetical protein
MDIRLKIRPARPQQKTEIIVSDEKGNLLFGHRADLASLDGRRKAAKDLQAKLAEKGIEKTVEQLNLALETKWNEYLSVRETEEAASCLPASGDAEDVDGEAACRLAETPEAIRSAAEAMLKDPDLLARVIKDIEAVGVAGEKELAATVYLVGVSRKLARPLAALVRGPSSSGKSYVIERTASLAPPESVICATQMTPQALFHMRPGSLRHRWIVAGERSRKEDDDAAEATRALREMISSGRLTKLMPVKNGNGIETERIEQEGPIAFVESTTLEQVFDEDENRLVQLFTDERKEQTRVVINRLADDSAGRGTDMAAVTRVVQVHHAAQRMLRTCDVIIPFAPRLGQLIPDDRVEARRAFPHLLATIQASALLHQRQRGQDDFGNILATRDDYQLAARLLHGSMRRLLGGGISDPARRFFERLRGWFPDSDFTAREAQAREKTSRSGVYAWIQELYKVGAIRQVSPPHGRNAAVWHIGIADVVSLDCRILPGVEEVFR